MNETYAKGQLVGYNEFVYQGKTLINYFIFIQSGKKDKTGLCENPQIVRFTTEQPVLSIDKLKFNQSILLSLDIDFTGQRKTRVASIEAV